MTQEAIKTRNTSKNKIVMIVSRVASESILNMNEIEDTNKNINKICKMMKQHPNMLDMLKIYCNISVKISKLWLQKESKFQNLTQNKLVYDELSPIWNLK
jgi:hypothetical protein